MTLLPANPANPAEPDEARLLVVNSGVFSNTGTIEIGDAAPGCLTVSNGGSVDAAQIQVGVHDTGCLNVRDADSTLEAQALHVGHSYTGTMALENGAAVTVQTFALHHTQTVTDVGEVWSRVTLDQEGPGANPSRCTRFM